MWGGISVYVHNAVGFILRLESLLVSIRIVFRFDTKGVNMYYINPRDLSRQDKEKIVKILIDYINNNGVSCSDAVLQVDKNVLSAPDYIAKMVEVVEDWIVEE